MAAAAYSKTSEGEKSFFKSRSAEVWELS